MGNIKKKKILYCITKANWGGAQKYVLDLATALNPEFFDVTVLVGNDGAMADKLRAKKIRVLILGTMSRDISIWKDFWAFLKIIKIFHQEKPDIIHLNSSKMGLLGAVAGRILGISKIIFTGHGWAFNEDRNKLQKKIIYWLHKLTIALTHKTIAVSEQTKNQIINGKYLDKKMVIIRNGVGEIDFLDREIARKKILEKLSMDAVLTNKKWLGTISELHKNKGLKYLIKAMHILSIASAGQADLPVVFIIGDGEKKEKLQAKINEYNLQKNIFLVGRIDEVEKYLKAFDIFTLTSITEALPYVILEAGRAGLPVIASGVGGIPEIIDDMQNGILVRPKESEEVARAVDFLLKNPEKIILFSHNIKEKIQEHFNKDTMIRKTVELYNR